MQTFQAIQNSGPASPDIPPAIVHQISVADIQRQTAHVSGDRLAGGQLPAAVSALPVIKTSASTVQLRTAVSSTTGQQESLFPSTPRWLCEEIGLNWWAAVKLYEEGWLSFSPEATTRLDETQEAELRFVGSLAVAGCDRRMLATLLRGLPKPYAYHASRLYYDWTRHNWRVLPDPEAHPESTFTEWLEKLVKNGDADSLMGILELTHDALARTRAHPTQGALKQ